MKNLIIGLFVLSIFGCSTIDYSPKMMSSSSDAVEIIKRGIEEQPGDHAVSGFDVDSSRMKISTHRGRYNQWSGNVNYLPVNLTIRYDNIGKIEIGHKTFYNIVIKDKELKILHVIVISDRELAFEFVDALNTMVALAKENSDQKVQTNNR